MENQKSLGQIADNIIFNAIVFAVFSLFFLGFVAPEYCKSKQKECIQKTKVIHSDKHNSCCKCSLEYKK
jgi:hypothetical protein